MTWGEGDIRADTPEARFERADPAERARLIEEHHAEKTYWGWCQRCHHRVEGRLKDIRNQPCPACGFGGGDPDIIHQPR